MVSSQKTKSWRKFGESATPTMLAEEEQQPEVVAALVPFRATGCSRLLSRR